MLLTQFKVPIFPQQYHTFYIEFNRKLPKSYSQAKSNLAALRVSPVVHTIVFPVTLPVAHMVVFLVTLHVSSIVQNVASHCVKNFSYAVKFALIASLSLLCQSRQPLIITYNSCLMLFFLC